jgi:hypothetical protein
MYDGPILEDKYYVELDQHMTCVDRDFVVDQLIAGRLSVGLSKPKEDSEAYRLFSEIVGWCKPMDNSQEENKADTEDDESCKEGSDQEETEQDGHDGGGDNMDEENAETSQSCKIRDLVFGSNGRNQEDGE